jgi:NTE family protein
MRVGLVLGAGGVLGGAWLTGGLHALATETGWDPASADHVVGTSAGAMMGSLCVAGVPPWFMVAHSGGEVFEGVTDAQGRPAAEADRAGGAAFRLERALPPIGPGSWRLALRTLARPRDHTPGALIGGWLPRGVISTAALRDTVRRAVPTGWVDHRGFWAIACDYATGRRVAFGREDAPRADLADAVAASCAIPGFYHPVTISERRYVDGGMHSPSNLDLLAGEGLDLVICLNPTSSLQTTRARQPIERLHAFMRSASGRRLGSEAKKVRASGAEVVLIQPQAEDLALMGGNLMSRKGRHQVLEMAIETVRRQLLTAENQKLLAALPAGEPDRVRRPAGPPSTWPPFVRAGDPPARLRRPGAGTPARPALDTLRRRAS